MRAYQIATTELEQAAQAGVELALQDRTQAYALTEPQVGTIDPLAPSLIIGVPPTTMGYMQV